MFSVYSVRRVSAGWARAARRPGTNPTTRARIRTAAASSAEGQDRGDQLDHGAEPLGQDGPGHPAGDQPEGDADDQADDRDEGGLDGDGGQDLAPGEAEGPQDGDLATTGTDGRDEGMDDRQGDEGRQQSGQPQRGRTHPLQALDVGRHRRRHHGQVDRFVHVDVGHQVLDAAPAVGRHHDAVRVEARPPGRQHLVGTRGRPRPASSCRPRCRSRWPGAPPCPPRSAPPCRLAALGGHPVADVDVELRPGSARRPPPRWARRGHGRRGPSGRSAGRRARSTAPGTTDRRVGVGRGTADRTTRRRPPPARPSVTGR